MAEEIKKYSGYGYHGGGRKKLPPEERKVYKTVSISGLPEQIEAIKQKAKDQETTVSKLVIKSVLGGD